MKMTTKQLFTDMDWDVQRLLLMEDWMQANSAPKIHLNYIHKLIEDKTSKCTMELFILKDSSWRKYF